MAWNEPGNNNKKRDPWNNGEPPDLEEALAGLKDKLRRAFGGKGSSGSGNGSGDGSPYRFLWGSACWPCWPCLTR
jgi:modulator of FtsH protease HflK